MNRRRAKATGNTNVNHVTPKMRFPFLSLEVKMDSYKYGHKLGIKLFRIFKLEIFDMFADIYHRQ